MNNETLLQGLYDREWTKEVVDEAVENLGESFKAEQCRSAMENLKTIQSHLEKVLERKQKGQVKELRVEMERIAREKLGMTPEEVIVATDGRRKTGLATRKAEPKYRNPDDPTQTWTGKGKRPNWYKGALERGVPQEDMLI